MICYIGVQTYTLPKVRSVGVQCSSVYRDSGVWVEDVAVQCSLLVPPTTSTPSKHCLQSDTSQSESDTDIEGGLDTSEYTLSQEDTSSM